MFETAILTPSEIQMKALLINKVDLVKYEDKQKFLCYCKDGCSNYHRNWSCPPFSPTYSDYSEKYNNALVVLFCCRLDQFTEKKPADELVLDAHNFLKSKIDKFMFSLEGIYGGISILNGHCLMCSKCACKGNHSCIKPEKMRYSMESLGLDVVEAASDLFQHQIEWLADGKIPEHSTILSVLLTNNEIDEVSLKDKLDRLK